MRTLSSYSLVNSSSTDCADSGSCPVASTRMRKVATVSSWVTANAERSAAQMRGEGWELLQRWSYGSSYAMVCLFRKVEALREGRPRA